jgi:SAM-dependent methyltransferase
MAKNPMEEIVYRLSRRRLRDAAEAHPTFPTTSEYADWRHSALESQFTRHFAPAEVQGRRVIDFGCGSGRLGRIALDLGAVSVVGVDLSEKNLTRARDAVAAAGLGERISFVLGRPDALPLDSASADVLLCFDVMEHVLDYRAIIRDWHRVLVPGGKVLIWWSLWMHPYGHHCYPLVNVPWAHLVLSDAALLRVCARTYELPEYHGSFWHLDGNGNKKANPYVDDDTLDDYLNKLTTWKFERVCRRAGFEIARREIVPFSGSRAKTLKKVLTAIPFLSDAFCGSVVYELRRR